MKRKPELLSEASLLSVGPDGERDAFRDSVRGSADSLPADLLSAAPSHQPTVELTLFWHDIICIDRCSSCLKRGVYKSLAGFFGGEVVGR